VSIEFIHLNEGWNAEPNSPGEEISIENGELHLVFLANPWAYEGYDEGQRIELVFHSPEKYRLGNTNDEGWYYGQCRYEKLAPNWGEFYQVNGTHSKVKPAEDWVHLSKENGENHYLFYFKDNTFECVASSYDKIQIKDS
jgi:hypothetical protein